MLSMVCKFPLSEVVYRLIAPFKSQCWWWWCRCRCTLSHASFFMILNRGPKKTTDQCLNCWHVGVLAKMSKMLKNTKTWAFFETDGICCLNEQVCMLNVNKTQTQHCRRRSQSSSTCLLAPFTSLSLGECQVWLGNGNRALLVGIHWLSSWANKNTRLSANMLILTFLVKTLLAITIT